MRVFRGDGEGVNVKVSVWRGWGGWGAGGACIGEPQVVPPFQETRLGPCVFPSPQCPAASTLDVSLNIFSRALTLPSQVSEGEGEATLFSGG